MISPRVLASAGLLLSLPFWVACQETTSTEQVAAVVPSPPLSTAALTLTQRFEPLLQGAWVNADYLAHVRKTRSPRQSSDYVGFISELNFGQAQPSGDSLIIGLGLGNHEGGNLTIYLRPGQQPNALPTNWRDYEAPHNFSEISFQLGPHDTTLMLTTYKPGRKIVRRTSYKRVPGVGADNLNALNQAVNTLLFAGRYTGQDSVGQPVQVQFTPDGRVLGLPGTDSYDISTDFAGGPGNDLDNVTFGNAAQNNRTIHFAQTADTLRLYSTTLLEPADDAPTLHRGRLLYTLIRRR